MARHQQHALDTPIVETLEQHAFIDHARGTEDEDLH
jgi:hypothetical protein